MSFDVNIGRSEPVIKAAANMNNDGGSGGNLGYMMGGGNNQKRGTGGSIFAKNGNEEDSFQYSTKPSVDDLLEEDKGTSWVKSLLKKIYKP